MRVILLEDIPKLGKKWDVKDVADGFARNYLIPKKLAKPATENEIDAAKERKAKNAAKEQAELAQAQELASKLDGLELEITTKLSDKGEAYSAVSADKIASTLKTLGFEVSKKEIKVPESIKRVGEYPVTVSLKHGLEAQITVVVVSEDEEEEKEKPETPSEE